MFYESRIMLAWLSFIIDNIWPFLRILLNWGTSVACTTLHADVSFPRSRHWRNEINTAGRNTVVPLSVYR